jgi:hypothetical protein
MQMWDATTLEKLEPRDWTKPQLALDLEPSQKVQAVVTAAIPHPLLNRHKHKIDAIIEREEHVRQALQPWQCKLHAARWGATITKARPTRLDHF